jgi:hypothetical protein
VMEDKAAWMAPRGNCRCLVPRPCIRCGSRVRLSLLCPRPLASSSSPLWTGAVVQYRIPRFLRERAAAPTGKGGTGEADNDTVLSGVGLPPYSWRGYFFCRWVTLCWIAATVIMSSRV